MNKPEQLIAAWRATMVNTPAPPEAGHKTLDELENHLRETLAPLLRSGMNETEAFRRAVAQLGSAPILAAEFRKLEHPVWLPVKVATSLGIAMTVLFVVALLAEHPHHPKWNFLLISHIFAVTIGYCTAFLTGTLGICFVSQRCRNEFPASRQQSMARATFWFGTVAASLTAVGIILGVLWAKANLGRWWAWDPKETSAFCAFLWLAFFVVAHRLPRMTTRGLLVLSILGNIIVGLAWGGPFLFFGSSLHPALPYEPILLAVLFAHGAFLLAGIAPAGWLRISKA